MEPTNKGKRWSEKEENMLKKSVLKDENFVDISNKHGRTEGGIKARVKKILMEQDIEADPMIWMKLFETEVHSMTDLGEEGTRMLLEFRNKIDQSSTESTEESENTSESDVSEDDNYRESKKGLKVCTKTPPRSPRPSRKRKQKQISLELVNNGNKWSKEEKDKLLEELRDKKSIIQISKEHGRTTNAILNKARKILWKLYRNEEMNVDEMSQILGMSEQEVKTMLDKYAYETLKGVLRQLSKVSENTGMDIKLEINIKGGQITL